jgi:hypothetical protein
MLLAVALATTLTSPLTAQEVNTKLLSQNGWYSDDTRADGSGSETAGTNLISNTLTDDPEATASGVPTHNSDINGQIGFGPAPGTVPAATHGGAVHLFIDGGASGKSQVSHRKDDVTGHGPGSGFGPGFTAEYSWMGDGTVSVTASLKFGIKTADFGSTGVSSRTGENVWDKVLIYEPGNLNGGTSDSTWYTETIDYTTGVWWFFDRTAGASIIGTPMTLSAMSTSPTLVGGGPKTVADVYALITAPGALITSVQFGIGSGNAAGSVFVNQMETSVYRAGMTTTFGCTEDAYFNGFEVDTFGWNVFTSPTFDMTRVASGTNGITSASGSFHGEAVISAGNWGGYSGVCGCSSSTCAGPVSTFPTGGYVTSIDIYLDVGGGFANDTRFDFSSAINDTTGVHRRDFIFNGAFLDSTDVTPPGAGVDRFVLAASNNSPGFPQGGVDPVAITATGWYTFQNRFYDAGAGVLACDFMIFDSSGTLVAFWTRSEASDIIGTTVGSNRYGWFSNNDFLFLAFDNAFRTTGPTEGELAVSAADCQDDANAAAGYQIEIELEMLSLTGLATGFQAFVEYDAGVLLYRGDLSTYTGSPFSLHISPVLQADDGRLELDGSAGFGDPGTASDALLATLVFDVIGCGSTVPANFEVAGSFPSVLSFLGAPFSTTLTDATAVSLDDTPPVLAGTPADITQAADAGSCADAVVSWTDPTATDICDPSPTVVCSPASGSLFPVGTTMVTCTATDACGNESTSTFDVTVTATNLVDVVVELSGSDPASRCIRFGMDSCSATADETLSFIGSSPAIATTTVEVPCGVWTKICAKDEQHTKWAESPVIIVGSKYVATVSLVLDGGDSDNDGDVDINDVTRFLGHFGGLAAAGGCPWNGTPDSDFSNNGAVGSEDYTFLVVNWLTASSCPCTIAAGNGRGGDMRRWIRVTDASSAAADLNGDGRVDVLDVEVFEEEHGLPGALSRRMRATDR